MTQSYYPHDSQNLRNSEGVLLNKRLRWKTTLERLLEGYQLTSEDKDNCIEALQEMGLILQHQLCAVGYNTV